MLVNRFFIGTVVVIFASMAFRSTPSFAVPSQAGTSPCGVVPGSRSSLHSCIVSDTGDIATPSIRPETKAQSLYERGLIYQLAGDDEKAISDFDAAIAQKKHFPDALAARGDANDHMGNRDAALADYADAAAYEGDAYWQLNDRCWNRAVRGYPLDRALADCKRSLELAPDDARTLDSSCFVRFRMGDYPGAIADCDAALRIQPRLANSLFIRGLAKLKSGDSAGGDADISAAAGADYRVRDSYKVIGIIP
jgi:tetratricopeptide (TPR) repeat protein